MSKQLDSKSLANVLAQANGWAGPVHCLHPKVAEMYHEQAEWLLRAGYTVTPPSGFVKDGDGADA